MKISGVAASAACCGKGTAEPETLGKLFFITCLVIAQRSNDELIRVSLNFNYTANDLAIEQKNGRAGTHETAVQKGSGTHGPQIMVGKSWTAAAWGGRYALR